jgi:hypothetical protein
MKKLALAALGLLLVGCATPLTTREQGLLTGTLLGAGTGAVLGSLSGHAGAGALIGGAAGALTGGLIGDAIQTEQNRSAGTYGPPPAHPRPSGGSIWVPGHYDRSGRWIPGYWIP